MDQKDSDIISRRQFFRRGASRLLPLLSLTAIAPLVHSCDAPFSLDDPSQTGGKTAKKNGVSEASGKIAGIEYVDMGLSVLWARSNYGASTPFKDGSYHGFGEVNGEVDHRAWYFAGYYADGADLSGTSFDTVAVNKKGWMTPSRKQIKELIDNCYSERTTISGTEGVLFTSKKNGNTLFLPTVYNYVRKTGGKREKDSDFKSFIYLTGTLVRTMGSYATCYVWTGGTGTEMDLESVYDYFHPIRPVVNSDNSGVNPGGNSCNNACSNSATSSSCRGCGKSCEGSCINGCDTLCSGTCNYSCGGTCSYVSAGSMCVSCAHSCMTYCYSGCKGLCAGSCQTYCINSATA